MKHQMEKKTEWASIAVFRGLDDFRWYGSRFLVELYRYSDYKIDFKMMLAPY